MDYLRFIVAMVFCLWLGGCDIYPKDPHKTLQNIRETSTINIGVIEAPPWASHITMEGPEIDIARAFANHLNVAPHWVPISIHQAVEKLDLGELDIVIGGLTTTTPYEGIGLTRPYKETDNDDSDQHVLGLRRGENHLLIELETFIKTYKAGAP